LSGRSRFDHSAQFFQLALRFFGGSGDVGVNVLGFLAFHGFLNNYSLLFS
jgi:hypothetical protein